MNNIMKYKNYSALIHYSEDDECLTGRVLGIADIISFQGDSVIEIRKAFKIALDDYLLYCKKKGKSPDKPYSGKIMIRIPSGLHKKLAILAESEGESLNETIIGILEKACARHNVTTSKQNKVKAM